MGSVLAEGGKRGWLSLRPMVRRLVPGSDFLDLARRALRHRHKTGAAVAMVAVGVEEITGTGGVTAQPAGDQVLCAAARRILAAPGSADAAALVGGGEFAILCGDLRDSGEADAIVRRIREVAARPLDVGGQPSCVAMVTGVAMASSPEDTAETLIAAASRAMHAAKQPVRTGPLASAADPAPGRRSPRLTTASATACRPAE
jgi:diguanylate cyclase (GGDEF)-like protein